MHELVKSEMRIPMDVLHSHLVTIVIVADIHSNTSISFCSIYTVYKININCTPQRIYSIYKDRIDYNDYVGKFCCCWDPIVNF